MPSTPKHIRTLQRPSHTPSTLNHAKYAQTHQDTTDVLTHQGTTETITPCQERPNTSGHYRDPHTPHRHYTMPNTPKHQRSILTHPTKDVLTHQDTTHTPSTLHHAKYAQTHQDTTEILTHPTPRQGCPNTSGHYRDPHTPHEHYTMPRTSKHIRTLQRPLHTSSTLHHARMSRDPYTCQGRPNTSGHYRDPHTPY